MAWETRLKAAWHGEAPNTDLAAMFAAMAGLAGLKQSLEDRRLEARIEQTGHDWRAVLAVGRIAAPLWLADTLVALAGAFADAETRSHPDRPSSVSRATFEIVAGLLAPVEDIQADVTAALADSNHRTALNRPMHIGPGGDIAGDDPPGTIPAFYAQGLGAGARQVHTSAAAALASVRTEITRSESPDWLRAGLQRLDGELQGAGARLDVCETRLSALAATHSSDPAALDDISGDLWRVVDVAAVAGQQIADPHLLAEARGHTIQDAVSTTAPVPPTPMPPPMPRPRRMPVEFVDPLPLPRIDPGAEPLLRPQESASPLGTGSAPEQPHLHEVALPLIGESIQPQAKEPASSGTLPAPKHPHAESGHAAGEVESDKDTSGEEASFHFPEIG